jgi:hypothetical protein
MFFQSPPQAGWVLSCHLSPKRFLPFCHLTPTTEQHCSASQSDAAALGNIYAANQKSEKHSIFSGFFPCFYNKHIPIKNKQTNPLCSEMYKV